MGQILTIIFLLEMRYSWSVLELTTKLFCDDRKCYISVLSKAIVSNHT